MLRDTDSGLISLFPPVGGPGTNEFCITERRTEDGGKMKKRRKDVSEMVKGHLSKILKIAKVASSIRRSVSFDTDNDNDKRKKQYRIRNT